MVASITHLFMKNDIELRLKNMSGMHYLKDTISCVRLTHMRKISHNQLMIVAAVVDMHYYKIKQHKH